MSLDIPSISPQELMDWIGTPRAPMLFDVRRREVFDAADRLIGGGNWRHYQETDAQIEEIPPSAEIVVYCVHGHQMSQSPVSRLRAKGVNARKLVGGIDAYVEAGGVTILKSEYLPKSYETPSRQITRERPKVDRLACPWFIKRFVDPRAEIFYADADWVTGSAVELDAIPFDIPDTDFSHEGEKCSFDAFLDRFDIHDPALHKLAEIVGGADTARPDLAPEAAGLLAMSLGISAANDDDHAALAQGMVIYDALYSWIRDASTEQHNWPSVAVNQ